MSQNKISWQRLLSTTSNPYANEFESCLNLSEHVFVLFYLFVESNHASFFRQNTKVKLFVRPKAWENFSNSRWISESKLLFIFSTSSLPNWDVIIMDQYFGHFINHTGENKIFLSQQRKVIYSVIWKQMLSQLEIILYSNHVTNHWTSIHFGKQNMD